ncbi:hypothetical protein [Synechococcus lacustris]
MASQLLICFKYELILISRQATLAGIKAVFPVFIGRLVDRLI